VPRNAIHPELLQDEIDELAQRVRFKLWLILKKNKFYTSKHMFPVLFIAKS